VAKQFPVATGAIGFSLIELMVTIAILAIFLTIAAPTFQDFRERSAVRGASEQFVGLLAQARFEAARRNQPVSVVVQQDGDIWCAGAIQGNATNCDCFIINPATAGYCALGQSPQMDSGSSLTGREQATQGNRGVRLLAAPDFNGDGILTFDPKLGLLADVNDAGTLVLRSPTDDFDFRLQLAVTPAGRTWACVPSGARDLAGYQSCP
jgi:prepilin-type N-terminal cleavage/methylation domain-containing protein